MLRQLVDTKQGQSVLEILIAFSIVVIAAAGTLTVILGSQSLTSDSHIANQALRIAQQNLENNKVAESDNFVSIASSTKVEGRFLEEITVTSTAASTKLLTSRVSWNSNSLRPQAVEISTLITDWQKYQATGGDTGGGGISGNWASPIAFGSIDLGSGERATGLDVIQKIVYMTATALDESKPDFFIVDATNRQSPFIVSSLNTGPGLNAIDAISGYAFVANNTTTAQLQVIDTSHVNNPTLVAAFTLPGVSGSGAIGNALFYANHTIYMGTKKEPGPEFHVIDVSNPASPVSLGSKEIGAGVNAIYVQGNLAYVAVQQEPRLRIYDVSNPSNIIQVGSFTSGAQQPVSLWLAGTTGYLGNKQGDQPELFILDVSSSTSIQNQGSFDIPGNVNAIRISGNLAFLATSDPNAEFQVWNVSNPASSFLFSSLNFLKVASGIDYEDNLVYISLKSNDALRIITSQ